SLYCRRANLRGRRRLSSSSSYAGSRTRAEKASRVPSGDQTGSVTSSSRSVSRRPSPPAVGITYSCFALRSRFEAKASLLPSGDQRGARSCFSPEVKGRGGEEPSTARVWRQRRKSSTRFL